ncbi:MAG: hypothetical protein ACKO3F_07475 [Cyanobium sp.]
MLLGAGPDKAIININIFDDGSDLKVAASGSLSEIGIPTGTTGCGTNGTLSSSFSFLCLGEDVESPFFQISGPTEFGGAAEFLVQILSRVHFSVS